MNMKNNYQPCYFFIIYQQVMFASYLSSYFNEELHRGRLINYLQWSSIVFTYCLTDAVTLSALQHMLPTESITTALMELLYLFYFESVFLTNIP